METDSGLPASDMPFGRINGAFARMREYSQPAGMIFSGRALDPAGTGRSFKIIRGYCALC